MGAYDAVPNRAGSPRELVDFFNYGTIPGAGFDSLESSYSHSMLVRRNKSGSLHRGDLERGYYGAPVVNDYTSIGEHSVAEHSGLPKDFARKVIN